MALRATGICGELFKAWMTALQEMQAILNLSSQSSPDMRSQVK
jgi:hypothetical protein